MTWLRTGWVVACAGALGCMAQVDPAEPGAADEVAVNAQAIMGGQIYHSCTDTQKSTLRSAAIRGRVYANSSAYEQCLDLTMRTGSFWFGPYHAQPGDRPAANMTAHINNVLTASRTAYPVDITCDLLANDRIGQAAYQGWAHTHPDLVEVDEEYLDSDASSDTPESVLWHEAMHSQNYHHAGDDVVAQGILNTPGVSDTVPYIVSWCMQDVNMATNRTCGDVRNACPKGATVPVASSYPDAAACTCIRDPQPALPADSPTPHERPTPQLDVGEAGDHFGQTTASGDFNGDGVTDLAVGAPNEGTNPANTTTEGAVYVYAGALVRENHLFPSRKLTQAPFVAAGAAGDGFGATLVAADFDDDGYDDLAVGAPGRTSQQGRVYLYKGSNNGLVPERTLTQAPMWADENGDRFGAAMTRRWDGSDWNLVVGAPGERVGNNVFQSGYVFVFKAASSGLLEPSFGFSQTDIDSNESGDNFGFAVAAGDIDRDGCDDIAVSAPGEDNSTGAAYVFETISGVPTNLVQKYRLSAPAGAFLAGTSLAIGRFVNQNWNAVAVGIPIWDFATQRGGVAIYNAHRIVPEPTPAQRLVIVWRGPSNNAQAGMALATLPRHFWSNYDRLAIGTPGGTSGGFVQVLQGGNGSVTPVAYVDQTGLGSNEDGDSFGSSLSVLSIDGDFDYNSTQLVVGSPGEGPGSDPASSGAISLFDVTDDHDNGLDGLYPVQYHTQSE